MKMHKSAVILLSVIIFLSLALSSCGRSDRRIVQQTKVLMGTTIQIKVSIARGENTKKTRGAIDKAFREIRRIEDIFSVYKPESEISRINKLRKNEKLQISSDAFSLIQRSLELSEKTEGAFDITVKPLVDLWDKAKHVKRAPSDKEIRSALDHVGYKNIVLDKQTSTILFKREEMSLDFGAIAKGYATDMAVKVLKDSGINNAVIRAGGNIYCLGSKSEKEMWRVGAQHPRDKNRIFLQIKLKDEAIDTSGDYEKYFMLDGKRYSHVIDPRGGYPVGDVVVSSTVITSDAATADALATAFLILGSKGVTIAESMNGVDAILVFKRGDNFTVHMTDGINKRYDIFEENL